MPNEKYKITKDDCQMIIDELIKILINAGLKKDFDLIAYGSYFSGWRDGLSDLDAILYFNKGLLPDVISLSQINKILSGLTALYKKIPHLKTSNFFADVFILDKLHASDGRFIMFDSGFIQRLKTINKNYVVVYGSNFLNELKPVSLRHQDEFDLAMQLHKIRNYLFFGASQAKDIVKFLKTLGRTVSIVLGKPINPVKESFDFLSSQFPHINYDPLYDLRQKTLTSEILQKRLFMDCWFCYESTLAAVVKNFPARSLKQKYKI